MTIRSRLHRLQRRSPQPATGEPYLAAVLDTGEQIALVKGEWVSWPPERPLPRWCKVYAFDPRGM